MTASIRFKLSRSKLSRWLYRSAVPVCDPLRFFRGLSGYIWFLADWYAYSRLPGAETMRFMDTWPQVHDRTSTTAIDAHYFYVNGWAARRIISNRPARHADVASQTIFVNLLGAVVPVIFLDYRPLKAHLSGLECVGASILQMPFANGSVESISCLHAAEHIGLGRYGDPLNVQGTRQAAHELSRVLAPGGNLYFAVPVGRPRLCFNSCRIHAADTICQYFANLELIEFSGVHDNGRFVERVGLAEFSASEYACGMFWFKKLGH